MSDQDEPVVLARIENFQGPLPPPELLREYNDVLPGAAERIVTMAEQLAQHRMRMQSQASMRATMGLVLGAVVILAMFVGAVWMVAAGQTLVGVGLLIAELGGLAALFITRQRKDGSG